MASPHGATLGSKEEGDADTPEKREERQNAPSSTQSASMKKSGEDVPPEKEKVEALWRQLQQRTAMQLKKKHSKGAHTNWNIATVIQPTTQEAEKEEREVQTVPSTAAKLSRPPDEKMTDAEEEVATKSEKRVRHDGVDALLVAIQKKQKATVLDTTKRDWRAFKEANAEEAEDLDAHQKSSEQFLEKQQFLTQAAQNEHEAEISRKHKQRT